MHQNPFRPGLCSGPRWGSLRYFPLVGRGGGPPPRSTPRTRRLGSQAPSTQNPGYASASEPIASLRIKHHRYVQHVQTTLMI